jgi:hypothetical protein
LEQQKRSAYRRFEEYSTLADLAQLLQVEWMAISHQQLSRRCLEVIEKCGSTVPLCIDDLNACWSMYKRVFRHLVFGLDNIFCILHWARLSSVSARYYMMAAVKK